MLVSLGRIELHKTDSIRMRDGRVISTNADDFTCIGPYRRH